MGSPLVPPPEGAMSAVFLLLVLPLVSAQTYHWGPCSTPKVQPGFNLHQVESKSLVVSSGLRADDGVVSSTVSGSLVRDREAADLLCAGKVHRGELRLEEGRNRPRAQLSVLVSPSPP